ncbi:MAG TPA: hypothetical protein VK141_02635 [Nitrosomonas sp.]|nr:hypothetical protein [Nitrosomonas sp.]
MNGANPLYGGGGTDTLNGETYADAQQIDLLGTTTLPALLSDDFTSIA